jgi:acetyl-CoA carboxylase biotin carboxyl carrier protein
VTLSAQDVAEITRLLQESQFDELHIESDGFKLTLRRGAIARNQGMGVAATGTAPVVAPAAQQAPAVLAASGDGAVGAPGSSVPAPLLGTFYRAPKPGAPPYVEVGSQVREDTIVGIIEVMKLMNTVRAGSAGTVVEILVPDGTLVEYGQVLMRLESGPAA